MTCKQILITAIVISFNFWTLMELHLNEISKLKLNAKLNGDKFFISKKSFYLFYIIYFKIINIFLYDCIVYQIVF